MAVDHEALASKAAQGGFHFYLPGMGGDFPMPLVFESGMPDPSTFPVEDFARLFGDVLREDTNLLQYGTPVEGDLTYGSIHLRRLLAERCAQQDGHDVDPSWVMLTSGGVQGISLAAQAFLDPGDVAAVECPTWEFILRDIAVSGAEPIAIPLDEDGLQVDVLETELQRLRAAGKRLKLLYTIPTYNVPIGVTTTLERRRRLVELAAEHQFVIIEDTVYADLRYEGDRVPSIFSLDTEGLVVKIDSFSKTLMPGLRLGWVTAHPNLMSALSRVRRDLGVGQLTARVVGRWMAEGHYEPHIERVTELYRAKRDAALAALEEYCSTWVRWNRPEGGYFIWLELDDSVDGAAMQAKAMAEGVVCRPGERFFGQTGEGAQQLRLAFTCPTVEAMHQAIVVLGKAAAESVR
jgi:2-aminoadipate transaminase